MVSTTMSLIALRCAPARLAASQHRKLLAVPVRRSLTSGVARAQQGDKQGDKQEQNLPAQQAPGRQERSVAPAGQWGLETVPTFGRMNQMFRSMEEEMNQLARAFGMPSLGMSALSTPGAFELPTDATQWPMNAKALAVDIKDTGKELEIAADVPGLSKEDIKVQVSPDRVLTISGERKSEQREGSEEEGNLRVERSYGTFMRSFRLPENVDVEGIKATTKDGVLRLTVPKSEEAKPKQIDVRVSD